jgi:hypothetical protein
VSLDFDKERGRNKDPSEEEEVDDERRRAKGCCEREKKGQRGLIWGAKTALESRRGASRRAPRRPGARELLDGCRAAPARASRAWRPRRAAREARAGNSEGNSIFPSFFVLFISLAPLLLIYLLLSTPCAHTGHAWVSDYGSPDNKDDFAVLRSYSPVHNVRRPADGGQYPAVMITTGDHDDRVVPLHSHKLTATLQHVMCGGGGGGNSEEEKEEAKDGASLQKNPIITRIDVRAGHGAGKPTEKVIAEVSDMFGFAAEVVGAEWKGVEVTSE